MYVIDFSSFSIPSHENYYFSIDPHDLYWFRKILFVFQTWKNPITAFTKYNYTENAIAKVQKPVSQILEKVSNLASNTILL